MAQQPKPVTVDTTPKNEEAFKIEFHSVTLNLNQEFGEKAATWWVRWKLNGQGEDLLSPISLRIWADLTNTTGTIQEVKTIKVSAKTSHCPDVIPMYPIYVGQVGIFFAPNFDISDAAHIEFPDTDLDTMLHSEIGPGKTLSGWLFYHSPIRCGVSIGDTVDTQMELTTFSGIRQIASEHKIVKAPRDSVTPHAENEPNSAHFTIHGTHIDLRHIRRTLYGVAPTQDDLS
jgi:hypothetical protein